MSRVPRLLTAVGPRSLNLTPPEAFLLSQVDALLDEHDLALVSGMTPAQTAAVLDRLAMLGAIEIVVVEDLRPPQGPPPKPPPSRPGPSGPGPEAVRWTPAFRGAPPYDPAELDEPADLEPERKRRVLDLYYRLDELTYYALLGVGTDADKKQIKSAYYTVAPEFHPDKYFRKSLGSFKQKIEVVFARITLAHDVLTVPERRAEYDEYLEQTSKNRAMSSVFDESPPDVAAILADVERAAAQALAEYRHDGGAETPPYPPGNPPGSPTGRPGAPVNGAAPVAPSRPQVAAPPLTAISQEESLRLRREALARKLMGGARRPEGAAAVARAPVPPGSDPSFRAQAVEAPAGRRAQPAVTPPRRPGSIPDMDAAQIERASDALRRRHEAALEDAKRTLLGRHLETGKAAMEKADYAAAANAYRIAASLAPDDPAVQATCNDALRRAASALADGYWKQAVYEEGQELWGEAALSYSKVCTGRPDNALAHERVAFTTLKMPGGNARRAVEFARKAVEIDPRKPDHRVTLARAYAAAGLEKSANGELDRALELSPKDPKLKAMVASARSGLSQKEGK